MDGNDELPSHTESSTEPDVEKEHKSDAEKDEHNDRPRTKSQRGEAIRSWIPVIVGVSGVVLTIITLIWGAWSFYFKEIIEPKYAPVNVSIDLHIQSAGIQKAVDHKSLSAVVVDITATNPSSRAVYVLSSMYQVLGDKIGIPKTPLVTLLTPSENNDAEFWNEEYADPHAELIAEGRPFGSYVLQPKETIKRSYLIHFPQDNYDLLEVNLLLPTVAVPGKVKPQWSFDPGNHVMAIKFFKQIEHDKSGKEITRDNSGRYTILDDNERFDESIGLQLALTHTELSLWPEEDKQKGR
jgi:hypothetical protein